MPDQTTSLQTYQAPPPAALSVFSCSGESFSTAQRMATALSSSTMVPAAFQGEAGFPNCLIALDLAQRINVSPLMLMQNLDVIHGRPSLRSQFLIGTVNSCGRFTPLRFEVTGEGDDLGCRASAKDKLTGETLTGTRITIGMAKAEGWYGKNGSKWKTMPEQMLHYRAASFWTRTYAPELSLGLQTREEAIDIETVDANEVPTAPTVPRARKRNVETIPVDVSPATPAAAPEPPTETAQVTPEPPAEPSAPAAPEPTMLERCEDWLSKTGIPFEFVQRKLSDVEAYKDAGTRPLEDLSDAELTILQRNGRSIERAWRASQPKP